MATNTKTTPKQAQATGDPTEPLREQQQWLQEEGRKLVLAHVDASEKLGHEVAAIHERVAEQIPFEPAKPLVEAQAAMIRQVTDAYVGAAREALI